MRLKLTLKNNTYVILDCQSIKDKNIMDYILINEENILNITYLSDEKTCNKCNITVNKKDIENYFYKMKSGLDGYMPVCKECYNKNRRENKKEKTLKEKEKLSSYNKKYWLENKEIIKKRRKSIKK